MTMTNKPSPATDGCPHCDVHSIEGCWGCLNCGGGPHSPTCSSPLDHLDAGKPRRLGPLLNLPSSCSSSHQEIRYTGEKRPLCEASGILMHLRRQREWSERTFGPGPRVFGIIDHIRKELREIRSNPTDLSEWIDVTILALDGAWRAGYSPEQIWEALKAKQANNEARAWPDWRTMPTDKAIEHDRTAVALSRPSEAPAPQPDHQREELLKTQCACLMLPIHPISAHYQPGAGEEGK